MCCNNQVERDEFLYYLARFIKAGYELFEVWQQGSFNADVEFGPPTYHHVSGVPQPLFPLAVDEWVAELESYYNEARAG